MTTFVVLEWQLQLQLQLLASMLGTTILKQYAGKYPKEAFFFFFTCSEQYQYHVKTHKDNISNCRETAAVVTLSEGQIAI